MKRFTHPQMHPCLWSQAEGSHKDNIEKVGQFYDHFLPGKDFVHKPSNAFKPKYTDFQADANIKIETCSMKEYIFQP